MTQHDQPRLDFLAHPAQRQAEQNAREIMACETVRAARERAREYLLSTDYAADPVNRAELDSYLDELTYSLAVSAQADAQRPFIRWSVYPGARYGLDNPDTIYRGSSITGTASYEITGRRNTSTTAFFQIMNQAVGAGGSLGGTVGFVSADDLDTDNEGNFTLTLGPEENAGPNHITLAPNAANLLIRDTLADWSVETPMHLDIRLVGEPATAAPTMEEMERRCAAGLDTQTEFWVQFTQQWQSGPANTLIQPQATVSGGLPTQVSAFGWFDLAPEQALVITLDRADSPYVGFQLGSEWYISLNYWEHTASLNNAQTRPNPDGSVTYVVSAADPGAWNWLDPVGHPRGIMFVRWQGLQPGARLPEQVRSTVVPVAEVGRVLTELGSPLADAGDRAAQLSERRAGIGRRPSPAELRLSYD